MTTSLYLVAIDSVVTKRQLQLYFSNHMDHKWFDMSVGDEIYRQLSTEGYSALDNEVNAARTIIDACPSIYFGESNEDSAQDFWEPIDDGVTVADPNLANTLSGTRHCMDVKDFLVAHSGKRLMVIGV